MSNLKLALAALDAQEGAPLFEVIIADDGSTDGTREWVESRKNIRYQWCGPNLGFRTSRTRNIGIAQANFEWLVLIDSDVMINPRALYHHKLLRKKYPDLVVVGPYHWAVPNPLIPEQVMDNFDNVMNLVPNMPSPGPPNAGLDVRTGAFHKTLDHTNIITDYDGLGFFSGNISWPTKLWWNIGGQDELMPSGMGEDAELGQRMRLAKLPVLNYEPIYGVHYHHERDAAWRQKMVQESIGYIDRKYGIGTYAESTDPATDPREMNLSMWYTRVQGGKIVKTEEDPTIFAVDGTGQHYVGIPSGFWLDLLGFNPQVDLEIVEKDFFEGKNNQGLIMK